jgi:hypothetical protein
MHHPSKPRSGADRQRLDPRYNITIGGVVSLVKQSISQIQLTSSRHCPIAEPSNPPPCRILRAPLCTYL